MFINRLAVGLGGEGPHQNCNRSLITSVFRSWFQKHYTPTSPRTINIIRDSVEYHDQIYVTFYKQLQT